jgi:hypothetical protein
MRKGTGQINFPKGRVDYSKVHDQVVAIDPTADTSLVKRADPKLCRNSTGGQWRRRT